MIKDYIGGIDHPDFTGFRVYVKVGGEGRQKWISTRNKTQREINQLKKYANRLENEWREDQRIEQLKRKVKAVPSIRAQSPAGVRGISIVPMIICLGKLSIMVGKGGRYYQKSIRFDNRPEFYEARNEAIDFICDVKDLPEYANDKMKRNFCTWEDALKYIKGETE